MIDVDRAQRVLEQAVEALEPIETTLERAQDHVLAEPIVADRDFPPTDRSAMDGFAVRSADLTGPETELEVVGEVRAGEPCGSTRTGPGQAVRILTGAVVPNGADAIVMVENTEEDRAASRVRIRGGIEVGRNVRRQGSDRRRGETVLEAGSPIHAPEIAALAAVGRTRLRVHRPAVVRVLSTGDEIVEPERTPSAHQLRNSNGPMLLAQLRELGVEGRYVGNAADTTAELEEKLREGLAGDLLLVTGGVSVGEYDLVGQALARAGMELLFHGVAMKPGKPILAGRCRGCLVVGLPGNPVSAYTGFAVLVAPALRKMLGHRSWRNRYVDAVLEQPLRTRPGRTTYHLARIDYSDGRFTGRPVISTGSGDVLSMTRANGLVITTPETAALEVGASLRALLWHHAQSRS